MASWSLKSRRSSRRSLVGPLLRVSLLFLLVCNFLSKVPQQPADILVLQSIGCRLASVLVLHHQLILGHQVVSDILRVILIDELIQVIPQALAVDDVVGKILAYQLISFGDSQEFDQQEPEERKQDNEGENCGRERSQEVRAENHHYLSTSSLQLSRCEGLDLGCRCICSCIHGGDVYSFYSRDVLEEEAFSFVK